MERDDDVPRGVSNPIARGVADEALAPLWAEPHSHSFGGLRKRGSADVPIDTPMVCYVEAGNALTAQQMHDTSLGTRTLHQDGKSAPARSATTAERPSELAALEYRTGGTNVPETAHWLWEEHLACPLRLRFLSEPSQHLVGCDLGSGDAHAKHGEGILDCIGDGGWGADGPGLPGPLQPEGVSRRRELEMGCLNGRQIGRGRHGIIHERAGQELPVVVVDDLFEQAP